VSLDLSYQAAQHVLSAPVTSALHLLKDISQNFPTRARSVAHNFNTFQSRPPVTLPFEAGALAVDGGLGRVPSAEILSTVVVIVCIYKL